MNYLKNYFENNQNRRIHKWMLYFDIYERYLSKFRNQEVYVLEIGINQGGSLQMWKDYFGDNAKIYSVDIDHRCKYYEEERIEVFIGSQADRSFLKSLAAKLPRIDILIDDGSHMPEHQIITFEELFPYVSENGVYLCEDLCSNYWERYGGAYKNSNTFIEYSKNFIDKLNAWHSEEPEKLDVDGFTRSAYSMHYYDSVLVIDKLQIKKPYHKQTGYFSHNLRDPEAIEKAISSSQQIIEANKNSYSTYMMLGNALSEKGHQQDAITNYQKALELEKNPAIYYSLGNVRLKQGDWLNAIANYQKALELNVQHPFCIVPCIVLRSLGTALNQQGDLDAAVDAYQEALKLEPNNANNYIGLAGIQFRMGKKQAAISSYEKAIELEPTNFRAYISLANIFKKEGQKDKAIALYEKAIELRPNLPKLHTELSQGYLDRAIEGYKRAIKLNPNISFDVYQNLATILKIQGKEDEAEKLIKSAPHPTKSNDS